MDSFYFYSKSVDKKPGKGVNEDEDEEDIRDEYRENFKIVKIGDIDDDSIFREKKIPCF